MFNANEEDFKSTSTLIGNIIKSAKPNLFVITGDTVDPSKWAQYVNLYQTGINQIIQAGIPWVWTGPS